MTSTPTETPTQTVTPTETVTQTPSQTPTETPTETPTNTPTETVTPTVTPTETPSQTPTETNTPTPSQTPTQTPTNTVTATETPTETPTATATPTQSGTPGETPTPTETITPTQTETPTETPTQTVTPTNTETPTNTPSETPTNTPTVTETPTETPTPTQTITPTQTETPTQTPTQTPTPTVTPTENLYSAYLFAEPNDSGDDTTLLNYALSNGAIEWYSYWSVGNGPNNSAGNYSNDLNVYAHQPSFINGTGNFTTPITFSNAIAQTNGQIISGVAQNLYTFGTIPVTTSDVNTTFKYFYSIWLPLDGIGGTLNNMTIDVGTTVGGAEIYNDIPSIAPSTNATTVTITSGAAIPAGNYRVIWISPEFQLPLSLPLSVTLYFRGDTKS